MKLGDDQFAKADALQAAGRLALVGMGVEPGLSDVFARYAARPRSTRGTWAGTGVLGPEAFDAVPFLDLLTEDGSPWGLREG